MVVAQGLVGGDDACKLITLITTAKGQGARHAVVGAQGLVGGDHDVKLVGQAEHVADTALPMVLCACAHHQ